MSRHDLWHLDRIEPSSGSRFMKVRTVALTSLMGTCLVSCRSTELVRFDPDVRQQRVQEASWNSQNAVANAGCAFGLPDGAGGSRVMMVERSQLPFQRPPTSLPIKNTGVMRMKVARISIPLAAPRTSALLACLVPASGSEASLLTNSVEKTGEKEWEKLAYMATNEGSSRSSDLYRSVAEVLLDSTLRSRRTSTSTAILASLWGGDPQQLPTITVTANANVVVFDFSSVMRLFGHANEAQFITWDMHVAQEQWSQDCAQWNSQMNVWDATKNAVAEAANEEANDLEALASAIELGLSTSTLESADATCKPTNGKKMCIDFFIMNCALAGFQGDCRDFDRNADHLLSIVPRCESEPI